MNLARPPPTLLYRNLRKLPRSTARARTLALALHVRYFYAQPSLLHAKQREGLVDFHDVMDVACNIKKTGRGLGTRLAWLATCMSPHTSDVIQGMRNTNLQLLILFVLPYIIIVLFTHTHALLFVHRSELTQK